jgi:DNA-binding NarL/FixJ family response regulator
MKVLLADDHQMVRSGLCALLMEMVGIEVVAEVGDGAEAIRLTRDLKPDVALLDIAMPKLSGLAALHQIRVVAPQTKVILLSMYDNDAYVVEAMRAGAVGYVVKDAAVDELHHALKAVANGDVYLSPNISRKLAQAFNSGHASPGLTNRQTEIIRLIAHGYSSKEIARELDLSIKTIETHRTQIMERLDIHDLAGLVRYTIRIGLISMDA